MNCRKFLVVVGCGMRNIGFVGEVNSRICFQFNSDCIAALTVCGLINHCGKPQCE